MNPSLQAADTLTTTFLLSKRTKTAHISKQNPPQAAAQPTRRPTLLTLFVQQSKKINMNSKKTNKKMNTDRLVKVPHQYQNENVVDHLNLGHPNITLAPTNLSE